ncbi:RelA/SpoT family protein [Helicobacter bilis]|uniref:RelA/SpoT family protein n=2 Tax=Helicobacter bilis TaxID=37372 RepID=A0A6D2CBM8_9HELI|nr:RelA/SpoT family protein [Helicobacter bilis]EMZ41146.1 RelA/SpoT family protein [Helicobacter bilis WiWa]TLE06311.1 RelA/SpoT family protein [Helicobacter bilis]TLE07159.1 RelA/SpoT family protein [Helicobacter bilis]
MDFFDNLAQIETIEDALKQLESLQTITPKIVKAIEDAQRFHEGQLRKSGIPYVVHPICVACIVAHYGGDEAMVCAALLHDIVEDTLCEIDYIHESYGEEVGALVDALTKIVEIRNEELTSDTSNEKLVAQALSFRKMLIASIQDARVLVIKISDRMHNMLTLDALSTAKQIRIAEETLVVYAPIAHRLGMSSLKNELEDKSFYYIYSDSYNKIQEEKNAKRQNLELRLNDFTQKISKLLLNNGFLRDSFEIQSRIKRNYSIHLKMQRKGISMDEMLDLLAVRIIVKNQIDCYRALGIVHINLNPIPSRLKDYIALPKENGYQTIHTTVFDDGAVYEVQIRTYDMHKSAEMGMAAHWKYKSGSVSPNLNWLKDMKESSSVSKSAEEFYEVTKNDLYREDIVVFGPDGKTFSLPVGSVVLDYAYAVHSDVGDMAEKAFVNNQRVSLLQKLKSGDIVKIEKGDVAQTRCTWIDSVKTSKAKIHMRTMCHNKIKEIDKKVAINILTTIFDKERKFFDEFIRNHNLEDRIGQAATDLTFLQEITNDFKREYKIDNSFFAFMRFKTLNLKEQKFDNLILHTNRNISELIFDHCCHPKFGDSVVAIKNGQRAIVHHKLCDKANERINQGVNQLFVTWAKHAKVSFRVIVSFENKNGAIAEFLTTLAKHNYNVIKVEYDGHKNSFSPVCEVIIESDQKDTKIIKEALQKKYRIIKFVNLKDAYQE